MTLPTRRVGPFTVSAVGLGCMNLSHAYGTPPGEEEGARLLNRALDLGITFLDTAAIYGLGANERLVGRAVGHRRHEFTLASKCVLDQVEGKRVLDGRPEAIARTLDGALRRLGVERIDLYYLHRPDRRVPIEDSVGALARAAEAGKIGAVGLSEVGADLIRRAATVHPVAAVQSEYSPAVRNPEIAVLDACREVGAALVAFSPVARGLLAGAVRTGEYAPGDIRANMPRFTGERLGRNLQVVDRFDALARRNGVTPAQLSLAWVLSRRPDVVPIPGTASVAHLEEDVAAATLALPRHVLDAVTAMLAPGTLRGARYPRAMQATVDTECFPDEELADA